MTNIDPRTGLESMDEHECWRRLGPKGIGRLAVDNGGQPDIFPVNYVVEGREVFVRTGPGTKLAAAVLTGLVAFEIDDFDSEQRTGWSVVVHGSADEVSNLDEVLDAEDLGIEPYVEAGKTRYVRIIPTDITGRRIPSRPAAG